MAPPRRIVRLAVGHTHPPVGIATHGHSTPQYRHSTQSSRHALCVERPGARNPAYPQCRARTFSRHDVLALSRASQSCTRRPSGRRRRGKASPRTHHSAMSSMDPPSRKQHRRTAGAAVFLGSTWVRRGQSPLAPGGTSRPRNAHPQSSRLARNRHGATRGRPHRRAARQACPR